MGYSIAHSDASCSQHRPNYSASDASLFLRPCFCVCYTVAHLPERCTWKWTSCSAETLVLRGRPQYIKSFHRHEYVLYLRKLEALCIFQSILSTMRLVSHI